MNEKDLKSMSNSELMRLYRELDDIIYVVECYSVDDVILMEMVCSEMNKREE